MSKFDDFFNQTKNYPYQRLFDPDLPPPTREQAESDGCILEDILEEAERVLKRHKEEKEAEAKKKAEFFDRVAYEQSKYFGNHEKFIYPSVRKSVLQRAGYKCEICGSPQAGQSLDMHHLRYFDEKGESIRQKETPEDLKAVCRRCHKRIHGH